VAIQRQTVKLLDKAIDGEMHLSSTPLHSRQPRTEPAAKTGCPSSLHLDSSRRRTEMSVTTMTEVTPPLIGARRSATEFRTPECFNTVAFETPGAKLKLKRTGGEVGVQHEDLDSESLNSSVIVAVRVRPFMARLVSVLYKQMVYKTVNSVI